MEEISERDFVSRAKKGDKSAFEALVLKYQRKIYFLCYRIINDHDSADDLAQETFVKAYFMLNSFHDGKPFYPWLRKIAINLTLNHMRRKRREVMLSNHNLKRSGISNPFIEEKNSLYYENSIKKRIEEEILSLPLDQKAVFVLRYYEELSYEEISKVLKIPIGTVMSRLNRAREKLKSALLPYIKGGCHETQKD